MAWMWILTDSKTKRTLARVLRTQDSYQSKVTYLIRIGDRHNFISTRGVYKSLNSAKRAAEMELLLDILDE